MEHKLNYFSREKEVFINSAHMNKEIEEAYESMTLSHDKLSADKISNSTFFELRTVRRKLKRYYPHIFHKNMSIIELLNSRYQFRENEYINV